MKWLARLLIATAHRIDPPPPKRMPVITGTNLPNCGSIKVIAVTIENMWGRQSTYEFPENAGFGKRLKDAALADEREAALRKAAQ